MVKLTKLFCVLVLCLFGIASANAKVEKVHATFESPTNTNTTWTPDASEVTKGTFTWSTTYYNQLRNIGLPTGDITKYKKLVVDTEIKSGEQFRILIYKGGSNLTLYASNGVNEFILADTLKTLYPDTYNEFLLACDEICLSGNNNAAPGEAIIKDVYLETYNDEGEKVFATFEEPSNTNTTWTPDASEETKGTFTWSTTYYNQLRNIGLPSGDISMYKKLVVDTEIKSGNQFRILIYKGGSNLTLYASNGLNEFILADTLKVLYPDTYNEFLLDCTEICLSGNNNAAPGEAVIKSVYLETYPENEQVDIPDIVYEEDPGKPAGDFVDFTEAFPDLQPRIGLGTDGHPIVLGNGDVVVGQRSKNVIADLSAYSKMTLVTSPNLKLVLYMNHEIDAKQNAGDYTEEEAGKYVFMDVQADENGLIEVDLTQFEKQDLNCICLPWDNSNKGTVWYILLTKKEEVPVESKTIGLMPGVWAADDAIFAAYAWNEGGNAWFPFVEVSEGVYGTQIPENFTGINVVRLKPATAEGFSMENNGLNWDNKWNQTADIDFTAVADQSVITITGWGENDYTISAPIDLDAVKAQLTEAIEEAKTLNSFANDAKLAEAITAAEDAVAAEDATAQSLAEAGKALEAAATAAAKTMLDKAVTLAKTFGVTNEAITSAEALLANEDATPAQLYAALLGIYTSVVPEIKNAVAQAKAFFETFNNEAATELADEFAAVEEALNGTDIDAILTAVNTLVEEATPYAKDAMGKVIEYVSIIDDEALNADIEAAKAAMAADDVMAMIAAAQKMQADFLVAAPKFVEQVKFAAAGYKDAGKTNGMDELEAVIAKAEAALDAADATIVTVGLAIHNLVDALKTYVEANTTFTVAGTADLTGTEEGWQIVEANNMTLNAETGLYEWTAENIAVTAESQPQFKVVITDIDGKQTWVPASDEEGDHNWVITPEVVGGEGIYNITITFNAKTQEIGVTGETEPELIDLTWTGTGGDIAAQVQAQIDDIKATGNKVGNITIELAKGGEYTLGATLTAPNNIFIYGNDATIDASGCVTVTGEGEEATTSPAPFITLDGTDAFAMKDEETASDHKLIQSVEVRGVTIKGLKGALIKDNQKTLVENLVIDYANIEMPAAGKNVLDFNGKGYVGKVTVTNSTIWANGMNTGFFAQYGSRPKNINGDWLQEFDIENNTIVNIANGKNFCDLKQNGTAQNVYTVINNIFVDCGKSGQTVVGFNKGQTSATPVWDVTGNYFEWDGACVNAEEIAKTGQKGGEDIVKNCVDGKVTFTDAAAGDFNGDFALTPGAKAPETLGAPMWTLNIVRTQAPFAATVKNDVDPAWEAVYAYTWTFEGETKVEQLGEWPGTQLTADAETGLYKVEGANYLLPEFIIFNNNAGAQTEDLAFEDGKEYSIFGEHEFAYQKYLVQNVVSGKFWSAGNSWGTQASLVPNAEYLKLVPVMGNGKYNIETQVNNGGEQYYFNGDYMDSSDRAVVTVTKAGILGYADKEETQPVYGYTIANGDNYYGWDGTSTVLGKNLAADSENALWVIVSLADAKAALANATADEPMDVTFLIEDHNFGRNNRYDNRWEGTGLHKGGDNANLNTESYMSAFDVYQTLSEVPNGVYELKAQAAVTYHDNRTIKEYDGEGAPVIYANEVSSDFNEMMAGDQLQSQAKMSGQFNAGEYWVEPVFVQVTDGTLKVGAKCDRADIWAVWDNFTLTYYGADANLDEVKNAAILIELAELRDKANEILVAEELEVASVEDGLRKAYDETANVSGTDAIKAAIETISAALDLAEASLIAKDVLPKMKQLTESTNVYTQEAYEEYYGQWYQKYEAGTLAKAEAGALQDPFVVTGWHASITCDNFLLSAWDTNPDFTDAPYYINTWSTEGVEGYSNYAGAPFGVPFFEYWTGDDNSLGERTLTATMNGLTAGWYDVTALVRVRAKNGYTAPAYGIKMQANNGDMTNVAAGDQIGESQFYMAEFKATGEVGEDGVLKIKFIVAADNNISWLSFQNVNFAPGEAEEYHYTLVGGFNTTEGGADDVIFGKTWDPTLEANDLVKGEDGLYTKKFENIELQAGTILYKVVRNHSWDINWGFDATEENKDGNADYVVNEAGKYNIFFTFNPADKLENGFNVDCKVVDATTDGISDLIAAEAENGNVYNLNGQKVMKAKNGLYIVNGKKVVKK